MRAIKYKKVFLYGLVSIFTFLIDTGISKLLLLLNLNILFSNTIGWISGAILHYVLSKILVFKTKSEFKFNIMLLYIFNLSINNLIVLVLHNIGLAFFICKIVAIIVLFLFNYWFLEQYFRRKVARDK